LTQPQTNLRTPSLKGFLVYTAVRPLWSYDAGEQGSQTNVSLESQRHIDADHRHGLFCPEIKRPSIEVAIVADFGANHDDIVNLLIPAYAAVYSIQRRISAELNRQVRASKSCKKDLRKGAAGAMTEWSVDNERWYAVLGCKDGVSYVRYHGSSER